MSKERGLEEGAIGEEIVRVDEWLESLPPDLRNALLGEQ